jgi:hypothetical protein
MTKAEWLAATDPQWMLYFLFARSRRPNAGFASRWFSRLRLGPKQTPDDWRPPYRLTNRALCLFDCACGRRIWSILDEPDRAYLEVKERYADGQADLHALWLAEQASRRIFTPFRPPPGPTTAMRATFLAVAPFADLLLWDSIDYPGDALTVADLLREVFGYPFHPPPDVAPTETRAGDGVVRNLAAGIYSAAEFERLPLLADALEDAGCTDAELLGHLRGRGPHVRGCWALDLILSKE